MQQGNTPTLGPGKPVPPHERPLLVLLLLLAVPLGIAKWILFFIGLTKEIRLRMEQRFDHLFSGFLSLPIHAGVRHVSDHPIGFHM